jgi:hypothetical protein
MSRARQDCLAVSDPLGQEASRVLVSNSHFQYWAVRNAGATSVEHFIPLMLHNPHFYFTIHFLQAYSARAHLYGAAIFLYNVFSVAPHQAIIASDHLFTARNLVSQAD